MRAALWMLLVLACDGGDPEDSGLEDSGLEDTDTETDSNLITSAAGGMVVSDDGRFRLSIPPGALDSDTSFTVTPVSAVPEYFERLAGHAYFYNVEPQLTFLEPVWFSIRADASAITQPSEGVWLWGVVNSNAGASEVEFPSLNVKNPSGDQLIFFGETSTLQLHGLLPMAELIPKVMCSPMVVGETCWDNEISERSLLGEQISVGKYRYQGSGAVHIDVGSDGYVNIGSTQFYPSASVARYLDYECDRVGTGKAIVEAGFGPYNGPETSAFDQALYFPTALEIDVNCVGPTDDTP